MKTLGVGSLHKNQHDFRRQQRVGRGGVSRDGSQAEDLSPVVQSSIWPRMFGEEHGGQGRYIEQWVLEFDAQVLPQGAIQHMAVELGMKGEPDTALTIVQ